MTYDNEQLGEVERPIVILTSHFSRDAGGVFEVVKAHATELSKLGCNVTIVSVLEATEPAPNGVSCYRSIGGFSPLFLGGARIKKVLTSLNPSAVHVHGLWVPSISLSVRSWQKYSRGRVVVSPHGMLDPWALQASKWKKILAAIFVERSFLARADLIHCLNNVEVANAAAFVGRDITSVVIENGVYVPSHGAATKVIDTEKKILLFLGRLDKKKGVLEAIKAWSILRSQHPSLVSDWIFVIAGAIGGDYSEKLMASVSELKLEDTVKFTGEVFGEAKQALLKQASAFILPSFSEGMPMAVLEAWASELPVFMTKECNLAFAFDVEAAKEITIDPIGMSSELASTLRGGRMSSMGYNGLRLVNQRFTWPALVERLHKAYLDL